MGACPIVEHSRRHPRSAVAAPDPAGAFAADQDQTCLVISGADAVRLRTTLVGVDAAATWRIPGEPNPVTLLFRPLVPGDPGCSRTRR
ncbi:MAG: hypothetical protein V9G19_04760 [Tetrasphaera sp.]